MMHTLPLYPQLPQAAIMETAPLPHDAECMRCELFNKAKTVCLRPEGEAGGVLVVGEWPTRVEDSVGRPFTGQVGKVVRGLVKRFWNGPIAFDYAVRCPPGIVKLKPKHTDACRPYGAKVMRDVDPQRIIVLGGEAAYSVLGRRVNVFSARRGYGWLMNDDGVFIPVFFLVPPGIAIRNRFMNQAFESDLKWALTCPMPTPKFRDMVTMLVETPAQARIAAKELLAQADVTYDVETHGRMPNSDFHIVCATLLGCASTNSWTWTRRAMRDPVCRDILKSMLEKMPIVAQNGKYDDRSALTDLGADVTNVLVDTRLFRKLLDNEASGALDSIAEMVGMGGHKHEASEAVAAICKELNYQANPPAGTTPTGRLRVIQPPEFPVPKRTLAQIKGGIEPMAFAYAYVPDDVLYRYNARDVWSTRAAKKELAPQLAAEPHLQRLWDTMIKDATVAIKWIEHWGIGVDKGGLKNFVTYCTAKETEALIKLKAYGDFNPASPVQLREFLFKKLGLPCSKETDSGLLSTDREVLDDLKGKHPAVDVLLAYRKYSKLNGTYATGMLPHVCEDSRIHTTYLLDGAGTGRLSSQNPNMQNAPRAKGNPEGKMFRDCFTAARDHILIEADQSQVELRVAAMLSGDKEMISDYKKGIDIHSNNARLCCTVAWGITLAQWDAMTKDDQDPYRTKIKTATFGRLYGKTLRGLAAEFGCSVKEVEKIDKAIWGRYHRLASWTEECVRESRRTGETWTWWNGHPARRRIIWKIADPEEAIREHAERTAYNTAVQGTAADYTTGSLYPIVNWMLAEGVPARVIGTVHDSILVEAHKTVAAEVRGKMREVMTGHASQGVPLVADFKEGEQWGSMEGVK